MSKNGCHFDGVPKCLLRISLEGATNDNLRCCGASSVKYTESSIM